VTTPCLPSFLTLPLFLPILPLHSPLIRRTTKRNGVSSSTVTATSPQPSNFKIHKRRGAWTSAYVSTEQQLHGVNYSRGSYQWQRAYSYRRRPTTLETQEKKTTETETRSPLATVYACTVPFPAKFWMPTNQITAVSARAHASRELCARALQASRGI